MEKCRGSQGSQEGKVVHDTLRKSAYAAVEKHIYPSACPGNEKGTKLPSLPADASTSPLQKKIKESERDKGVYIRLPAHLPLPVRASDTETAHKSTRAARIPRLALRAPQEKTER
jgi:hypothetical protein